MLTKISKAAFGLAALLLLCNIANAQPNVKWSFDTKKTGDGAYTLHVKGALPETWHIYGINESIDGLSAPAFSFDYENVKAAARPAFTASPQHITDAVFENKKTAVYTGAFDMMDIPLESEPPFRSN